MTPSHDTIMDDSGYTLLELLVAVAIIALLAVPISGSIALGLDAWTYSHQTADKQEKAFLVQDRLSEIIKRAYPLDNRRTSGVIEYPMIGTASEIEFSAPIHADPDRDALYRVRLSFDEGVLKMGFVPDFQYLEDTVEWSETEVISGVESFQISYLEGVDASSNPIWLDRWGNDFGYLSLPLAVRLEVQLSDPNIEWQTMTIKTVVEERAFCRYLASERECLAGANAG